MKAIKKLALVLAAIATVFAFASCSDDDDNDGPAAVTTWRDKYSFVDEGVKCTDTMTIVCYDDNTFTVNEKYDEDGKVLFDGVVVKGTYTGDTAKAGETVNLTVTQASEAYVKEGSESMKLVSYSATGTAKVSSDGKTLTVSISKLGTDGEFEKQ